jgi:hypothetical protein
MYIKNKYALNPYWPKQIPTIEKVNTCILLETTTAWDDWPPIRLYDGCKQNKKEKQREFGRLNDK